MLRRSTNDVHTTATTHCQLGRYQLVVVGFNIHVLIARLVSLSHACGQYVDPMPRRFTNDIKCYYTLHIASWDFIDVLTDI